MARPSNPLLSRSLIATTALELIDSEGGGDVSMRRIARKLKVHPSSLYNHFSSRLELIEEIRGIVSSSIDLRPLEEYDWETGVLAWGESYRAAFAEHPNVIPLLLTTGASSPVVLNMYEQFAAAASRAGWEPEDVIPLLTAIESFILGLVLDMSGPNFLFDTAGQEVEHPYFVAALGAARSSQQSETVADRAFELGLRGLLAGLAPATRRA